MPYTYGDFPVPLPSVQPNTDVLACLVVGSSVGVVDTWNPAFTNELDSSQVSCFLHSPCL